ncbi:MFS transporter [Methylocystis sp. MJC1]|jgi:DHA2 family multidrug resistance protein|uniref:MFS transporter n=1 Tax=Methylocystis sp. MJC1 TaxID=2654282 RepID=UPI0013ED2966|nr:MFS transporter [Methylocystis sp. MJC1]KAF2992484.1 Multidrug export protein EmrB [Methylocystis sp. MJC1]MBU6526461.1 MFS transporter [Methylocystis sp. MJC1]UZX12903.1 MFS transporter [Methylocystis sp. MJC1]
MAHDKEDRLTGWRFVLFNAALAGGNIIVLSNIPGYTVLAPYAAGNLQGVTLSFGVWATTDHMMGIVLGLPLARWLSGRYGDNRVYAAAFVAYAIFSFACALAETIWFFVPARFLLGLAGGVILPLGQGLVLKEIPEKYRPYGVAWWGVLSMTPFTLGVFMGGFWAEYFTWRMLFYSNIFLGLPIAGVVSALLYGRPHTRRIARFDLVGFLLIGVVFVGTQTILNQGNDFDWLGSTALTLLTAAVVIALPTFIVWELGERNPVLDIRLFSCRNYAVATFCSVVGFLFILGTLSVFVGQLQLLLGYTSSGAGAVYLSMALLAAPVAWTVHFLVRHIDMRLFASLNFLGFSVTLTWLGLFDKLASFDQITVPMIFFGFFLAAFFAPLAAIAVQGLESTKLIRAAEELAMLRTAAGAFGIALQSVVQFRRTPFHQLGLADQYGGRGFPSLDLLSQLTDKLEGSGMSEAVARAQAARLIRQQALLMGLDDAFLLAAVAFFCLAIFVWLARGVPRKKPEPKPSFELLRAEELMEQP